MDPEKILEYFIRFESIPLSRKGMRASGRHNSLFFSRQQVDPLFKISRLRGAWSRSYANFGEKLGELPGKSISFRPCVFSTSPFLPCLIQILPLLFLYRIPYFFSFDYTSLLHHRRHYAAMLLRLVTVYRNRVSRCVMREIHPG